DDSGDALAAQDRDAKEGFGVRAADLDRPEGIRLVVRPDADGASGLDDPRGQPRPELDRVALGSRLAIDGVWEPDVVRCGVVERDEHRLRIEDRSDPLADEVDDRSELELFGKGLADLVDEGELRVPLTGLLDRSSAREGRTDVLA